MFKTIGEMEPLTMQTKELILDFLSVRLRMPDPAPNNHCSQMRGLAAELEAQHQVSNANLSALLGQEGVSWNARAETMHDVFHVSLHRKGTS